MGKPANILITLFIGFFTKSVSQTIIETQAGANIGLNIAIGSHVNRFGFSFSAYYIEDFIQLNLGAFIFHNFTSFGPKGGSNEAKISLGLNALGGTRKGRENEPILSPLSNQSNYKYSAGYAYSIIISNNGTSQPTGMIGFNLNSVFIVHENDILAGTGDDKFRTGGLLISYQENGRRYALNYMGWTGDPRSDGAAKVKESDYPSKHGYKNLSKAFLGKYSHGILAGQIDQLYDYGQVLRFQAGFDAEQIRNLMQNRLMHEKITGGYHYPMLQPDGEPFLYQHGDRIRKVRPYLQIMSNPTLFY